MTYTNDNEPQIAGLAITLKALRSATHPISLTSWLSKEESPPVWIPLAAQNGVTKVMPVAESKCYSRLMQSICQRIGLNTEIEWQGKFYELTGVEVDTQDLHVVQIPLFPAEPLSHSMGRAIHAQFFQWLATADPALAEQLHQQNQLPFTLSLSPSSRPTIRISLLKKDLLTPLLIGLSQDLGKEILLGKIACRMGSSIIISPVHYFKQLVQTTPKEVIEMEFLSPTSFKQEQQIQPFPLPEMVFASLARRWNVFAPSDLKFPQVKWQSLVAMYELKTKTFQMEGGAEIGTVGWVRYRFPDPEQARIASVLAQFALFAGVGRKTSMGMGQVRLKEKTTK